MKLIPLTPPAPVLGLYASPDAAAYYRVAVPMGALAPDGAAVQYGHGTTAHREAARIVVFARLSGDLAGNLSAIEAHQAEGRRVLIDYDDDPDTLPSRSLSARERALLDTMRALMRAADGLVTTNATLAARLRRYHPDVRVVPNYVRPMDWPEPAAAGPVVTLTGSISHIADWRMVAQPLAAALTKHPAARLRVAGHLPSYLRPLCADHRSWTGTLSAYPAMLAGSGIGLCPLPATAFNEAKSPIKLYEFALSGAAVIGSPTQYGPVLRAAGLDHAVARSSADWRRLLDHYLSDPAARQHDARTLRAYVTTALDAARHTATIRAAYAA